MQPADDVKFRGALAHTLRGALVNLFERVGVRPGSIGIAAKSAQLAMRDADIRGINVAVDVVIGDVAVALFADVIRQPADGEQVGRAEQGDAVVKGEAFAGQHLVGDGLQVCVLNLQFSHSRLISLDRQMCFAASPILTSKELNRSNAP
jgi:hypothetical protein